MLLSLLTSLLNSTQQAPLADGSGGGILACFIPIIGMILFIMIAGMIMTGGGGPFGGSSNH